MANSLDADLALLTARVVNCPHYAVCREECASMTPDKPMPDYVGEAFKGLVIVATNPGVRKARTAEGERERDVAAAAVAGAPTAEAQQELARTYARFMENWKSTLVNRKWRERLGFDIRHIAFVNIVKCRTDVGKNDPDKISPTVARRCYFEHTKPLLDLLAPSTLVSQWKGSAEGLRRLGDPRARNGIPFFNGQRNLLDEAKISSIAAIIETFVRSVR